MSLKKAISKENSIQVYDNFSINSYFQEVEKLLVHIYNIIFSPKLDLTKKEEIVRTDKRYRADKKDMLRSYREVRFYKVNNNKVNLERIYSYSYEEDIDTYENRFLVYVVRKIYKRLISLSKMSYYLSPYKLGIKGKLGYEKYGSYSQLLSFRSAPLDNVIDYDRNKLRKLISSVSLILSSSLFKRVKYLEDLEIHLTNIISSSEDYLAIYRFYLSALDTDARFLNKLIRKLKDGLEAKSTKHKDGKESYYDSLLRFEDTTYLIDGFTYKLNGMTDQISLTVSFGYSRINYTLKFDINSFLPYLELTYLDKVRKISLSEVSDYSSIVTSLAYTLPYIENICPICGSESSSNHCLSCNARYLLIEKKGEKLAWIYNLPFIKLGGEGDDF
ncbi:MAG: DUF2357 domain-containing protein [Firmicutes bacterium]|uniref:DUF2357 domain-containing protein n=1 Tax=Candidatus Scatoplasma merdavium TaxID=2840932 RepID=A0A9D9D8T5_9BACL|nr:DUF2357 domain-containing protein [Candidatus Scatoplasma merdavium]